MKNNIKILIAVLITICLFSLPFLFFTLKIQNNKKKLHIDSERYNEVHQACSEKKSIQKCADFLREDIDILVNAHKNNKESFIGSFSIKNSPQIIKYFYKLRENEISIEPAIFINTMLLKKVLLISMDKPVDSADLDVKIQTYIRDNFSNSNKLYYLKVLDNQNEELENYIKKLEYKERKRVKGPTPAYRGWVYDF